jgi:DZIP3/ hRUL138-like HEPN
VLRVNISDSSRAYSPGEFSAATETERQNFYHLACLIMNIGAEVVRKKFLDCLGNESLAAWLQRCKDSLECYVKGKNNRPKLLDRYQWKMLVGSDGSFANNPNWFDLSSLIALIDIHLRESPNGTGGLSMNPDDSDRGWKANIVRLRTKRNRLFGHVPHLSVSNDEYLRARGELTVILRELGVSEEQIKATHAVVPVERLIELERRYSLLPAAAIRQNMELVQRDLEDFLKMALDPLVEFRASICGRIDELYQRINDLEADRRSSQPSCSMMSG